jgi:AraC-like DNA-binding protein
MSLTACMERHYQPRSPSTSYPNIARQCQRRKGSMAGCHAKSWCVLWNIQDQLGTDLTVSGIAQAVYMTPYHFTRLFKESTGQSPYQYVVEARVRKAKELLTTGKFTIIDVAHRVGFADQSHLTRHFKRVFGLPPKQLLNAEGQRQWSKTLALPAYRHAPP